MNEPPDGIIITISGQMLKEKGYRNWLRNFLDAMGKEDWIYWMRLGTIPKYSEYLMYVYFCIGGKIRYRANFVGSHPGCTMRFNNGDELYGKAWITMAGPVVTPEIDFPRKGFRGFRYTQKLF